MFYETELLIGSNVLAFVLGVIISRWSQRVRYRHIDPSRFADNVHAEQAGGTGRPGR